MMIYSVKLGRRQALTCLAIVAALGMMTYVNIQAHREINATAPVEAVGEIQRQPAAGETTQQQIEFLNKLGYECMEQPAAFCEVIIPPEFDGVYQSYNQLQLDCGYDLTPYQGHRVKRYTYTITNRGEQDVVANLLVYGGEIIGGDVCSVKMDGFMEGLRAYEKT
ncbi:MAG: DUF4830 domain-containing protein [Eubacteriales bacterium]